MKIKKYFKKIKYIKNKIYSRKKCKKS